MKMKSGTAIAFILATCFASAASAKSVPATNYERVAILDEIRADVSPGTTFTVEHLRVANKDGASIAYAEVRPTTSGAVGIFKGWVLLKRESVRWHALLSIDAIGMANCRVVRTAYDTAIDIARLYDATDDLFSDRFFQARNVADRSVGKMCDGEVVMGGD